MLKLFPFWDPLRGDPRFEQIVASFAPKKGKAQLGCPTKRSQTRHKMNYWEIIADNLSKAGWTWGCVSSVSRDRRTIWIVDAHRGDGKRFVVRADEKLTAFLELEAATQAEQPTA
jgi:hypothetical protein